MDNLQDGIHLDDALLKSEKGNCVVCGKTIDIDGDESKFYQHVESHITELWNSFTIQEKEVSYIIFIIIFLSITPHVFGNK